MEVPGRRGKPLGWRAKIGVITPEVNTVTEPEFGQMAVDGVTFHFSRMPIHRQPEKDDYRMLFDDLDRHAGSLANCGLDVITYNCTVGSMACPAEILLPHLGEAGNAKPVATASAVLEALRTLGVSRISLATPYPPEVNDHEKSYMAARGVEVVAMAGMTFPNAKVEGRSFAEVSPEEIFAHACAVDRPAAEAIFLSCANFGSAGVIQRLEDKLRKPVISTNSATCWASLRAAGINDHVEGFGRLLSVH